VGSGASIGAVVAALDLSLVRMLRSAMAPGQRCGVISPQTRIESRRVLHPTPRFEPRRVLHPTPRFTPRPVHHPEPNIQPADTLSACPPLVVVDPAKTRPPIPPVWSQLPPITHPTPPALVKVVRLRPDIIHKGSLIDFFV
jgi:hypothetical protein